MFKVMAARRAAVHGSLVWQSDRQITLLGR